VLAFVNNIENFRLFRQFIQSISGHGRFHISLERLKRFYNYYYTYFETPASGSLNNVAKSSRYSIAIAAGGNHK